MTIIPLAAAAALLLAPVAAFGATPLVLAPSLAAQTPADFARQVSVRNDDLGHVVLSTHPVRGREGPVRGAWSEDAHLSVTISRATGTAFWRVSHDFVYPRFRDAVKDVHYQVDGAAHHVRPATVKHWHDHCPAGDTGQCRELTRVMFELPEEHVRKVAASWRAGSRQALQFRFMDAKGERVTAGIAPAELAGLLHAYDAWREKHRD